MNKNIKKEFVALANTKGWTIYIGIDDNGKILGLSNIKNDIESLSGMIREGIIGNLTTYTDIEIKNIDFSHGEFNVKYLNSLLIVRINNKEIKMQLIDVTFINDNDYRVDVKDVPVTKYTLEQLKYVSKIVDSREPRIPLRLNPGVSKESVVEAKKLVRTLKNN